MTQDPNALLPCPWCGNLPKTSYDERNDEHWIACESDNCEVCPATASSDFAGLVKRWNRRASPTMSAEGPPVIYGPEKQAYPGGLVYREGVSTGTPAPEQQMSAEEVQEACARVCEMRSYTKPSDPFYDPARGCANAIRSLDLTKIGKE